MDSLLSFPVGLFHPLQHAGLARRTPRYRLFIQVAAMRNPSAFCAANEFAISRKRRG
jgi:hypothetical protein